MITVDHIHARDAAYAIFPLFLELCRTYLAFS